MWFREVYNSVSPFLKDHTQQPDFSQIIYTINMALRENIIINQSVRKFWSSEDDDPTGQFGKYYVRLLTFTIRDNFA